MTMRTCVDRSGVQWEVFEVFPAGDSPRAARLAEPFRSGWLCFQSPTERRRLAPIPGDWQSWDDVRLLAALEQGQRSVRRTPQPMPVQRPVEGPHTPAP